MKVYVVISYHAGLSQPEPIIMGIWDTEEGAYADIDENGREYFGAGVRVYEVQRLQPTMSDMQSTETGR